MTHTIDEIIKAAIQIHALSDEESLLEFYGATSIDNVELDCAEVETILYDIGKDLVDDIMGIVNVSWLNPKEVLALANWHVWLTKCDICGEDYLTWGDTDGVAFAISQDWPDIDLVQVGWAGKWADVDICVGCAEDDPVRQIKSLVGQGDRHEGSGKD